MKRHMLAATTVVALLFLLTVGAPHASADSFDFTSCHATTGCVAGSSYGTVTLTTSGTGVLVDVVLTGGSYFVETQAGADELFLFNATSTMTVSGMTATYNTNDVTGTLGGLTYVFDNSVDKQGNVGVHADGTGYFTGSIECTTLANCNGSSIVTTVNDLHFTVNNATLAQLETPNPIVGGVGGNLFVSDIAIFGNGANTGDVDVTPSVPDGGMTLMLLGGALFGLETLRRKIRA